MPTAYQGQSFIALANDFPQGRHTASSAEPKGTHNRSGSSTGTLLVIAMVAQSSGQCTDQHTGH